MGDTKKVVINFCELCGEPVAESNEPYVEYGIEVCSIPVYTCDSKRGCGNKSYSCSQIVAKDFQE